MLKHEPDLIKHKKHWYLRWWALAIFIILFLFITLAIVIGLETYNIYQKIKRGEVPLTENGEEIPRTLVSVDDDPYFGPLDAPVTIVAFEDFQCPYCKESFMAVKQVRDKYPDAVRFVFRDFPIEATHPGVIEAHLAAECAHDQDKFWEYHDKLFLNQENQDTASLVQYAKEAGLDITAFTSCLENKVPEKEVQKDLSDGVMLDIAGTPVWFFNGFKVEGSLPLEAFELLIDRELASQKEDNVNK